MENFRKYFDKKLNENRESDYKEIRKQLGISNKEGEEDTYTGHDHKTRSAIIYDKRVYYLDDNNKIDYEVE